MIGLLVIGRLPEEQQPDFIRELRKSIVATSTAKDSQVAEDAVLRADEQVASLIDEIERLARLRRTAKGGENEFVG